MYLLHLFTFNKNFEKNTFKRLDDTINLVTDKKYYF